METKSIISLYARSTRSLFKNSFVSVRSHPDLYHFMLSVYNLTSVFGKQNFENN